ncbi:MAG TPA: metallophosphoesterase family protein [Roseiflexaceae bacterium]|nr:metallophosphoesterase family protein [Roseiflexaceae bacterium]
MRYAILSDIHANLPALRALIDDLAARSVDSAICLGDAVGYYADAAAAINMLRDLVAPRECVADGRPATALPWVAGNHEWGVLDRIEAYQFSPAARAALTQTRADLPAATKRFLADLPQRLEIDLGNGLAATLVHAAPTDPVGATGASYIENSEDAHDAAEAFDTQVCLLGHTHYPRVCRQIAHGERGRLIWETTDVFEQALASGSCAFGAERMILNPGSVGQPRDGDPRASYAILDTTARTFAILRVPYDIEAAQSRVRAWLKRAPAELLNGHGGLAERLARGI